MVPVGVLVHVIVRYASCASRPVPVFSYTGRGRFACVIAADVLVVDVVAIAVVHAVIVLGFGRVGVVTGLLEENGAYCRERRVNPRGFRGGCGLYGICEFVEIFQEMFEGWIGLVRMLWLVTLLLSKGLEFGGGCREVLVRCLAPLRCLGEEIVRLGYFLLCEFDFCLC